jgi:AbiU2
VADERIEKWTRWIDGTIKNNVLTMHLHRETWRTLERTVAGNEALPESYWWEFLHDTYAASQAMAVRRQADTHRDVASLGKLIQEIRDDPTRISREFWVGLWDTADPVELQTADAQWQSAFGASLHVDPEIAASDFALLVATASGVKAYVDEQVAHADASAASASITLTLKDVHDAIDVIGELFRKYYTLLTASSMATLVPIIEHDWTAVFRVPWTKPERS